MAAAVGFWMTNGLFPAPRKARSPEPKKERNHHYTFDVDDNGLDINGFILQTDKHKGKRQKFRVYLDSNENNRFDKNDVLLGRIGLKTRHSKNGVGGILDEDELGQIEVKFKKPKSNASMRVEEENYPTIRDTPLYGILRDIFTPIKSLSFTEADGSKVVDFYGPTTDPPYATGAATSSGE